MRKTGNKSVFKINAVKHIRPITKLRFHYYLSFMLWVFWLSIHPWIYRADVFCLNINYRYLVSKLCERASVWVFVYIHFSGYNISSSNAYMYIWLWQENKKVWKDHHNISIFIHYTCTCSSEVSVQEEGPCEFRLQSRGEQ